MLQYLKARYELFRGEEGVSAIEYGILAAGIAVVIIVAVNTLGGSLNTIFGDLNTALTSN